MSIKVLYCEHCKNLLLSIKDVNVLPVCCGEKMHVLVANSTDAAAEKHVPVLEVEGNTAKVTVSDTPSLKAVEITVLKIISAKIIPKAFKGVLAPLLIKLQICKKAFSLFMEFTQLLSPISIEKSLKKSLASSGISFSNSSIPEAENCSL